MGGAEKAFKAKGDFPGVWMMGVGLRELEKYPFAKSPPFKFSQSHPHHPYSRKIPLCRLIVTTHPPPPPPHPMCVWGGEGGVKCYMHVILCMYNNTHKLTNHDGEICTNPGNLNGAFQISSSSLQYFAIENPNSLAPLKV